MHDLLQGPGEDPLPDPEASDDAGQAGAHVPGAGHPHAISRLKKKENNKV